MQLPEWANRAKTQTPGKLECFEVDADKFYPAILKQLKDKLGADGPDPAKPTQYWLEVAYQCMKMDMQRTIGRFNFKIIVRGSKKFALKNHPDPGGNGVARATKGREARDHYRKLHGEIPS